MSDDLSSARRLGRALLIGAAFIVLVGAVISGGEEGFAGGPVYDHSPVNVD